MTAIEKNMKIYSNIFKKVNDNLDVLITEFKHIHQLDEYNNIVHDCIFIRNIQYIINVKKPYNKSTVEHLFYKFIDVIITGINSPLSSFMNSTHQTNEIITLFCNKDVFPNMQLLYNTNQNSTGLRERGLFIDLLVDIYNKMYTYIKYPVLFAFKQPINYSNEVITTVNQSTDYLLYCSKFLQLPHTIENVTNINKHIVLIIIDYL